MFQVSATRLRGQRSSVTNIYWDLYMCVYGTRNSNRIVHILQRKENFTGSVIHAICTGQTFFVTRLLTRDLFVVANLLTLPFPSVGCHPHPFHPSLPSPFLVSSPPPPRSSPLKTSQGFGERCKPPMGSGAKRRPQTRFGIF